MSEEEWLRGSDPGALLHYLDATASDRKLRLFACACCRRLWHLLRDPASRQAVETSERFADGLATRQDLRAARKVAALLAVQAAADEARDAAWYAARWAAAYTAGVETLSEDVQETLRLDQSRGQCALLRDLFGNPFRPVSLAANWLRWQDGTVVQIARVVYDERRFQDLPILADALEDAGCDRTDLLEHCRSGGEHVRGCWPVDLVLGQN